MYLTVHGFTSLHLTIIFIFLPPTCRYFFHLTKSFLHTHGYLTKFSEARVKAKKDPPLINCYGIYLINIIYLLRLRQPTVCLSYYACFLQPNLNTSVIFQEMFPES